MAAPHRVTPNMGAAITNQELSSLVRQVQSSQLYNRQLASICQVNGLKSTGVKADLQRRIVDHIQEAFHHSDPSRFHQILQSVANAALKRPSPQKPSVGRAAQSTTLPGPGDLLNLHATTYDGGSNGHLNPYHSATSTMNQPGASYGARGITSGGLFFKSSPFFTIQQQLGNVHTLQAMSQHRSTMPISLRVNEHAALRQCVRDTSYRIMVFCAAASTGEQDISFPYQSEIKINGGDFKANLRGLKNKPGSTRPVDITNALRLKSSYTNNIEFTYALTQKPFYLVLYVCKSTPIPDLVSSIASRKIPKADVIAELNKKAEDPDIVTTSQVLSLKCPLSYMRLQMPCRGITCTHIQCFDATSYLQLQEQGPQWLCPICNKSATFSQLAVDEYVKEILEQTSKGLETVTIDPRGRWSAESSNGKDNTGAASFGDDDDDDDDELEISEVTVVNGGARRLETPKMPTPNLATPVSAGSSAAQAPPPAPRGAATTSQKRPASKVIDLTLSSDEDDDEPIQRSAKRRKTGPLSNGSGEGMDPGARPSMAARYGSDSLGFLSESPLSFP